ncbi:MAG: phytanoyl-CoA dioxygenase family protein [Phycisphaeraceae bacterium]
MSQNQSSPTATTDHAGLDQDQLDAFWRDGYLPLGKLLDDDHLATMRPVYDQTLKEAEAAKQTRTLRAGRDEASQQRSITQLTNAYRHHIGFMQLLYHAPILDAVESIIGPNIMLFHDQVLYKPPHTGSAVPWHQDNAYWKLRPANAVSCWLTLDDVDRDNGAMQVIPGSHLHPRRHGHADSDVFLSIDDVDQTRATVVDLPAGGAMLHHCQTLHHTQPNVTDRPRRAFAIHFMTMGTRRDDDDQPLRVGWEHPILRARL